ncbi:MAG: hypothetical protein EXX96DRAFT_483243 [Benjaminiella poitrasii]|nr:MAG: hypothetical protein EXX96DRAFT_483243 [Benjaminiella poitrasii]
MDRNVPALQTYNGGIIFVSYLIAVIGAMTTLELLQRRTHIRGYYNWFFVNNRFLLFTAAALMGSVGIWSMHFIGNNSLTITLENGEEHSLSYSTGFTFLSLVVAILTMLLAFAFVGITEKAKIGRIIPSGVIAGFGIVSMHYLGQIAIDFFVMENKIPFVIGAALIAVCAVTAALFIFFKLREQWADQWYKRLGCAMLMGAAVCGMHYTALIGTIYYPGDSASGPPTPLIQTGALIGIVSAIVVTGCIILFFIAAKTKLDKSKLPFEKKTRKRLILNTIFFDTNGRIMVKIDGIVPMKEVLNNIPDIYDTFSTSHPLFTKLFATSIQWCKNTDDDYEAFTSFSSQELEEYYTAANTAFVSTATELMNELRLSSLSDLGHLFDSILIANTISKKSMFSTSKLKKKPIIHRTSSMTSWLLSSRNSREMPRDDYRNNGSSVQSSNHTNEESRSYSTSDSKSVSKKLSVLDSDADDRHIFLVKRISSNKVLVNLLSAGFRFAEPVFIAKKMSEILRVPSEYMLNYFRDMMQMSETANTIYTPTKPLDSPSFFLQPQRDLPTNRDIEIRGGIFVAKTIVDTTTSFSSKHTVLTQPELTSSKSVNWNNGDNTQQFVDALKNAAKCLINMSSYGKPLASSAKLYSDVLDIPAFALRAGPCQLILFRAHIITPGTRFAINQTLTESLKCIPFSIYFRYTYYITSEAMEKYRAEQNKNKSSSIYLTHQRLYLSSAAHEGVNDTDCSTTQQQQQMLSSLPPPPRIKRNKFTFPTSIDSLDLSHIKPIALNLLPVKDRFWWLNNMFEETHHA